MCYQTWAYDPLPAISAEFLKAIQGIAPDLEARAEAYGERCVFQSGKHTFSALETDFFVTIPVTDLNDKEAFGQWIEKIMAVVNEFGRPRVPGTMDGKLNLIFETTSDHLIVSNTIQKTNELLAQDLHGIDLFEAFEQR
jgi:hypothetical protein